MRLKDACKGDAAVDMAPFMNVLENRLGEDSGGGAIGSLCGVLVCVWWSKGQQLGYSSQPRVRWIEQVWEEKKGYKLAQIMRALKKEGRGEYLRGCVAAHFRNSEVEEEREGDYSRRTLFVY